ncbi:hypothetical protein EP331_13305 [bacterium]|nr:MAG: hypothetical protein EP331_13305 [bacterium]
MITDELKKQFEIPGSFAIGTTDLHKNPRFTRIPAIFATENEDEIILMVSEINGLKAIDQLKVNPKIAVSCNSQLDDTTYQFKGIVTAVAELNASEIEAMNTRKSITAKWAGEMMGPDFGVSYGKMMSENGWKLNVKVLEIYNQTPGKMAGKRIS